MKFLIVIIISVVFVGCSSMKKDQTYKEVSPTTEFTFKPNPPHQAKSIDKDKFCTPENFDVYKSVVKNNTLGLKHKLMFLIQATTIVELSLENYIDFESKKYGEGIFIQKDEMLNAQLQEIMGFVRTSDNYANEFSRYSNTLHSVCDVSYCKKDLPKLRNMNNVFNRTIQSQEKVLGLKIELLNGLYSYKRRNAITLDQLEQLQNSIISTFNKTKIQEKSVEQNEAALSLFNDKFDKLCSE